MLAPTIGRAAKRRADSGDAERVLGQLQGEAQGGFFDRPDEAASEKGREQGEQFLEQIFGSRHATREAASRSGADENKVAEFLPALAAMLQGGMQEQTPRRPTARFRACWASLGGSAPSEGGGGGLLGSLAGALGGGAQRSGQAQGGSPLGALADMPDADGDGIPLDDILERVMR